MAPQQNTFSVIAAVGPNRDGGPPSKPPMTSKQAQKLYKQANKGPRRSKAEQKKWEKERQEEIRKELERERASVKAKAARERKKAKEDEARENRRRNGQPLVDCRPSQDTIARFVRGNGTNRKRDSSGEPIPTAFDDRVASPEIQSSPPALPQNPNITASLPGPDSAGKHELCAISMPPPPLPAPMEKPAVPVAALQSDQPPITQPTISEPTSGLPATLASMGPPPRPLLKSKPKPKPFMMPRAPIPAQQPQKHKMFKLSKPEQPQMPPPRLPMKKPVSPKPAPQIGSQQMPPPPKPLEIKPFPKASQVASVQMPPPSTQAIVQDCFDDFFPTASQLALELEEELESKSDLKPLAKPPSEVYIPSKATRNTTPPSLDQPKMADDTLSMCKENARDKDKSTGGERETTKGDKDDIRVSRPCSTAHHNERVTTAVTTDPSSGASQQGQYPLYRQGPNQKPVQRSVPVHGRGPLPLPPLNKTGHAPEHGVGHRPSPKVTPKAHQPRPSDRGPLQEISSNKTRAPKLVAVAKPAPQLDDFFPLICTQDLMMSSQEVQEIECSAKTTNEPSNCGISGGTGRKTSPLVELDLSAIDWDDDLDDF
ncbi:hypothetical protein CCHL11_08050 [Colletotrichum chlorophyti]|uniref:Uncharacterized protein n=1 Tax=Colletotrichum chlorophyti TaxID=708187 RepID=A0A1Q8RMA4_9PEZI|nr:hypothetical protein CCHL11_08050 [Colletotrichum chlorophyti]